MKSLRLYVTATLFCFAASLLCYWMDRTSVTTWIGIANGNRCMCRRNMN